MIGYYIHHHGSGHLHRALAIQQHSSIEITGISSCARPSGWRGDWLRLADDAEPKLASRASDPAAGGYLHYVPERHAGLRGRMAALSQWIEATDPSAIVVDVSVEVALLARLHGVPVVAMAQPGVRIDLAHTLGYGISSAVLAPWPAAARGVWRTAGDADLVHLGALSRFAPCDSQPPVNRGQVVVLNGTGGASLGSAVRAASAATPDWDWVILDRMAGTWVDDPWPLLRSAELIISHCGQNAVAEISAARRPAILIPQDRPFDEQRALAAALSALPGIPATVLDRWPPATDWPDLLASAAALDGSGWSVWNDGAGVSRAAAYLEDLDRRSTLTDDARISA